MRESERERERERESERERERERERARGVDDVIFLNSQFSGEKSTEQFCCLAFVGSGAEVFKGEETGA